LAGRARKWYSRKPHTPPWQGGTIDSAEALLKAASQGSRREAITAGHAGAQQLS